MSSVAQHIKTTNILDHFDVKRKRNGGGERESLRENRRNEGKLIHPSNDDGTKGIFFALTSAEKYHFKENAENLSYKKNVGNSLMCITSS